MMNRYEMKKLMEKHAESIRELDSLYEERERIKSVLLCITPSYGGDSGSGGPKDKIGENVPELVDLQERVIAEIDLYTYIRDSVRTIIRMVSYQSPAMGQCLLYRYVRGWSPTKTAREMCYAPTTERDIHRSALDLACRMASEIGIEEIPSFSVGVPVI